MVHFHNFPEFWLGEIISLLLRCCQEADFSHNLELKTTNNNSMCSCCRKQKLKGHKVAKTRIMCRIYFTAK